MSDESSAWTHMPALSTNHDTTLSQTPNQSKCQIDSTHLVYNIEDRAFGYSFFIESNLRTLFAEQVLQASADQDVYCNRAYASGG